MMNDSELLSIFWEEATEHLETLNNTMLQVEMISAGTDEYATTIKEMNRIAHSLKGAARAVGISSIETISHYMEEVFGVAMKGQLELTPDIADTIYDGLDLIQGVADGNEPDEAALADVLARLEQTVAGSATASPPKAALPPKKPKSISVELDEDTGIHEVVSATQPSTPEPEAKPPVAKPKTTTTQQKVIMDTNTVVMRPAEESIRVTVSKLDRLMAEVTELFVARMNGEEQQRAINELRRQHSRWVREWRSVRTAYIRLVRRLQDQEQEMSSELPIIFRFLEFNQRQLIETRRQLTHLSQSLSQDNMHLASLADQLQDDIGGMRLVPFESILGGFQRMVRDIGRDTNKQLKLDVVGQLVEIDKAVLDSLKDPLMHLLRNSIDHGIEDPQTRERHGKTPNGHVGIAVEQRGSEIVIYIRDDGQGIDANKVRRSIVKNGLMSETDAASLSDEEARSYIFYSGLSTNDEVTSLSGRGMGMDIVRDRIESLRGRVSVRSVVGEGTTVTLNVPVSLTRIRCVLVRIGDQIFAVPSVMVVWMDTFQRKDVFTAEGTDVLLINERPMPLASLAAILQVPSSGHEDTEELPIVALEATDRGVAFEVDELVSEQELVLKPLGPELVRARFVSGAALLGTGDIIIVLDANDLVRRATGTALPTRRSTVAMPTVETRRLRVLVVDDSITTRTLEKNILETAGFNVSVAMDGAEAWNMLPQNDFDVIISDVEMPKMTGLELCAKIKSSRFQDTPVILLTSLGKPEQREAGLRAGANAYLVKSRFDQGELLQTIQEVM